MFVLVCSSDDFFLKIHKIIITGMKNINIFFRLPKIYCQIEHQKDYITDSSAVYEENHPLSLIKELIEHNKSKRTYSKLKKKSLPYENLEREICLKMSIASLLPGFSFAVGNKI